MLELHFSGSFRRFEVSFFALSPFAFPPNLPPSTPPQNWTGRANRGTSALNLIWLGSSSVSRESNHFHLDQSKFYILKNLFSRRRGQLIAIGSLLGGNIRNRGGFE